MDRAERLHRTRKVVSKRLVFLKNMYGNEPIPERKIGRCRKNHPHDCGHAKCYFCHCDKLDQIPTRQQVASDLYLEEFL